MTAPDFRENDVRTIRVERNGRVTVQVECPFCGETVETALWSLAGSGKRCPCGAKHSPYGTTAPKG